MLACLILKALNAYLIALSQLINSAPISLAYKLHVRVIRTLVLNYAHQYQKPANIIRNYGYVKMRR